VDNQDKSHTGVDKGDHRSLTEVDKSPKDQKLTETLLLGTRFRPASISGSGKFGGHGTMSKRTLAGSKLSEEVQKDLVTWMNYSKTDSTWSNYRTVERLIDTCQEERRTTFEWPMTTDNTLLFTHWLIKDRRLKASTVNNYLAGLRQAHITRGLEPPQLRTTLVNQVIKGRANQETVNTTDSKTGRAAMTVNLMRKLKQKICQSNLEKTDKLLVWTVATTAFFGAFRIHEILGKHESTFDPHHTLLLQDVSLTGQDGGRTLSIRLKCPKERRAGRPTVVDILETGGPLCPIRAYNRWATRNEGQDDMPLFRWKDGTPLTGRKFNCILKDMLGDLASTPRGKISTHSFRSAVPTILAELGHSENDIKAVGRWSSRAFTAYMKGSRTQRLMMARRIAGAI